jgi:hypothetical protein
MPRCAPLAVAFLITLAARPAAGQARVPQSVADIPSYPGAVRDASGENAALDSLRAQSPELAPGSPRAKARTIRLYGTSAPIEQVVRFYRERLGGRTEYGDEMDERNLSPGQTTPIVFQLSYAEFGPSDADARLGEKRKAAVARARSPWEPDRWLSEGRFWWSVREANGDVTHHEVNILDRGFADDQATSYVPRTEITFVATTQESESSVAARADTTRDLGLQARVSVLTSHPPTERDVGVALYPGAQFDAQVSAGMSSGEQRAYVFMTADPLDRVVAFYEAHTGKHAMQADSHSFGISLTGSSLPDLTIQSNLVPWPGKTVITIMKHQ